LRLCFRAGVVFFFIAAGGGAQTRFAVDDFAGGHYQTQVRADLKPAATNAAAQCTTTGTQNIAVIAVTTPSNPALPASWSNANIYNAYFAASGLSLNTYWQDASYGQTSAAGNVYGPYALSQNYDCSNLDGLASAAISAASSSFDRTYNRFAIVFPAQSCVLPDLGAIGGYGSIGCSELPYLNNQIASVAWLPIFPNWSTPANSVGILAHEHGHNLGLNHSNTEAFSGTPLGAPDVTGVNTEYGDPYSVMGNANILSTLPTIGQYTGEHKAIELNWLQQTEVTTSGTYTLAPYEASSGTRVLRIERDPVAGSWLWAEYRQPMGVVDSTLSNLSGASASNVFNGILIHYENPNLDLLHTYLLNYDGTNNFHNAVLTPGQTWSDPDSPLTLTANSANSLTVNYDPACATLIYGTAYITVNAPSTCSWTASTGSSWITLTGATSGTGNGIVNYTLAPNTGTGSRLGFIAIDRQTLPIIQEGTAISVAGISPATIYGETGQVSVQVDDAAGASDVPAVYITFSGSENCAVTIYPPSKSFALTDDAGTALLGPTAGGTLTNSVCSVNGAQSSIVEQGTLVTVNLSMSFSPATFAGSHHITIMGQTGPTTGLSSELTIGTWTVPAAAAPAVTSIVPLSAVAGNVAFTLTVTGTNFSSGESVLWNGTVLATTFVNATTLTAAVPANLIAGAGAATVTVSGASGSQTLTIVSPALAGISPSTAVAGSGAFTLTATGTNFLATESIQWNGTALVTTYGGASLTATVPASLIASAGSATVTVSGATGSQTFTITGSAPVITPGGIVPVGSTISTISPGAWISIYGSNLAPSDTPVEWTGNFPTTLGGVSVLIDGKPAYLSYVSPGQINAQVPDDANYGTVAVQIGSATSTVTLAEFSPSWIPLPYTSYAIAVIPGANGSHTIASSTQPVSPGQTIELYAVGFGPTSPVTPAGQVLAADAQTANAVTVTIGGVNATVKYAGLILAGLYQINVVVPQVASGNQSLQAAVGGAATPSGFYLPVGP